MAAAITIIVLLALALFLLFMVSGKKGFRTLLALSATVVILAGAVMPLIIRGYDPIWITLAASLPVILLIVYCTEGFTRLSHLSVIITAVNFAVISLLVAAAVSSARFTGIVSDVADTVGGQNGINLPELLAAGIMLGTLGALTEMVVTQVATVLEFISANPSAGKKTIFRQSYHLGITHVSSIINTLFLIYAGMLLPLLVAFTGIQHPIYEALNYEPLASEIVRTLTGVIGLMIAMPSSTAFAVWWLKRKS